MFHQVPFLKRFLFIGLGILAILWACNPDSGSRKTGSRISGPSPESRVAGILEQEFALPAKLPVPVAAFGQGQIAPADFSVAAGMLTGDVHFRLPSRPVGVALFVTADHRIETAFFASRLEPVGGVHTRCHLVENACWYTRPDTELPMEFQAVEWRPDGSRVDLDFSHSSFASFLDSRPMLKQLKIHGMHLRLEAGRIELDVVGATKKQVPGELRDAAYYWLTLAINERAQFLLAKDAGRKFFETLPGATLEVKKNKLQFAMAGDCSMLTWSILALHELYPFLHI